MNASFHTIVHGSKSAILCFGGMSLQFGGIPPFEWLRYLSTTYTNACDLYFFIDRNQCWYHKGIQDITTNIDDTVEYLNSVIEHGKYEHVVCMGTSAGGYGAILFGSLCKNVHSVIGFVPQTILTNPIDRKYSNLQSVINTTTNYIVHGDTLVSNRNELHHIFHCENIEHFPNVKVIRHSGCHMKQLRDSGVIQQSLDDILFCKVRCQPER